MHLFGLQNDYITISLERKKYSIDAFGGFSARNPLAALVRNALHLNTVFPASKEKSPQDLLVFIKEKG